MNSAKRRQRVISTKLLEKGSELDKASVFYQNEGLAIQTLTKKLHYGVEYLDYTKELPLKKGATGLKIQTGEEMEDGTGVIVFDIDCKQNEKQGLELYLKLLERYEVFNNTRTERTKSKGYHIFLRVPIKNYKEICKIVFTSPLDIEIAPMIKPLEVEVFINSTITVAPTKTYKGNYVLFDENEEIANIDLKQFQRILHDLQTNSIDTSIVKCCSNKGMQSCGIDKYSKDTEESLEILKLNNIRYKIRSNGISVWEKGDASSNGDYLLNENKKLWNLKTFDRIDLKEFIKIQNGGKYVERKICW